MILKFNVSGMSCAACSARVEKVSGQVPGVNSAEVNLLAGSMVVDAENAEVANAVMQAVQDAGYQAALQSEKMPEKKNVDNHVKTMQLKLVLSAVFLIVLMYFTMGHMVGLPLPSWYHGTPNAMTAALLQFFLTLPVVIMHRQYFTRGIRALVHRAPNMDSLIAIGSGAAMVYGVFVLFRLAAALGIADMQTVSRYQDNLYFESAAMILTLVSFGKFLESRAKGKTGEAVRQLMDLRPKTAVVLRDDKELTLPIAEVKVSDIVIVRSGGNVPVDGTVIDGRAAVDQSALTGESIPAEKTVGDAVAASSVVTEGYLKIRADKVGEDTTLSQVIRLVEQAGGTKAPIARLADKVAGIFVPTVMAVSLITFAVWMLCGAEIEFALTTAIAVLVISCPCALGLATPVAIMVGTGRGAQMGILFKNAQSLENLHKVNTVVLDKTGTLTVGKPQVTHVLPEKISEDALLMIAASLEAKSEHPFAKAIMQKAEGLDIKQAEEFKTLPGMGIRAKIEGKVFYGGNARLMEENGITVPDHSLYTNQGKTPLYFATQEGEYLGAIIASDILKDDAKQAVTALQKQHMQVVMLTGDNEQTAHAVAAEAGISDVIAQVLPADKSYHIEHLKKQGKHVLMVGDGINDAPALALADVSMAIGSGTDIAIESADIVLMRNTLSAIESAVALSKATIRNIRQNLFWAFFYNSLGIPIAAGVLYPAFGISLNPMIAAAAMSMSSVFVVSNALRLRFFKTQQHNVNTEDEKMETVIKVEGMMCTHCKARVEQVCKGVAGVEDAVVDLEKKQVTVTGNASADALKKVITDAGYQVI